MQLVKCREWQSFHQWPACFRSYQIVNRCSAQENLLYKSLSCEENLNFFAQIYGLERKQRRYQVRHCLKAVNLTDRATSPVETLSGGMQRRLNIAVASVHQPKLAILDEPTTGLDIKAR
jgi:ABC-2 type transport system ATP-binding protein